MGSLFGGGGSRSSSETNSTNTDGRVAVQDGIGLSGADGNSVSLMSNDTAVVADIVDLGSTVTMRSAATFDTTVARSAELIERLIDSSTGVSLAAINAFQPTQNKEIEAMEPMQRTLLIGAALAAAAVILGRSK